MVGGYFAMSFGGDKNRVTDGRINDGRLTDVRVTGARITDRRMDRQIDGRLDRGRWHCGTAARVLSNLKS